MREYGRCPAFGYECEYVSMVEAQAAEIERLRGALEYIVRIDDHNKSCPSEFANVARAALAGKAEQ